MLFLISAGLTLIFGIMNMINLAHGSLYMIGAYLVATMTLVCESFWMGLLLGVIFTALIGMILELTILRRLYQRDHLSQVIGTFSIMLICNEIVRLIWGTQPVTLNPPENLSGPVEIFSGFYYPAFGLCIIGFGLTVALILFILITHTKMGMQVRAGASNRQMALAMGVDVKRLFTLLFGIGAALCGIAGGLLGPVLAVQVGMGESILILAFVVVVIGGVGSVRGAFVGALIVGLIDTASRTLIPVLFNTIMSREATASAAPAVASIMIYILMASVLFIKPQGLFPLNAEK
jgi:branched-chain amino acid transport system permease protein